MQSAQIPAAKAFREWGPKRRRAHFGLTLARNLGYYRLNFALITRIRGEDPL